MMEGVEHDFEYDDESMYGRGMMGEDDTEVDDEAADDEAAEDEPELDVQASEDADESALVDEGDDEAVPAGFQAAQQGRARDWAKRLAADQRREAQRAASTQQDITKRIRSIQAPPPAGTYTIGSLQGNGVVTAVLPNGRETQMKLSPAPAPIREVNRLRAVINYNDKRQGAVLAANTRAIKALAMTQAATVQKLTAQQVKSDKELGKRIVEGDTRVDKRITTELAAGKAAMEKSNKRMLSVLKRERRRSIWNNILLTSAMPFFAAYGDRSDPFSRDNLILTGSLAGWLLADEVVDQVVGPNRNGRAATGLADVWSYLAPLGNAATVSIFLRKRQHERFIAGATELKDGSEHTIPIPVADGSTADFIASDHVAVASALEATGDAPATISARVDKDPAGKPVLKLKASAATGAKVFWIVDTEKAVVSSVTS